MTAALAGGVFDIGDRVAAITGSGSPPFGSRGTVVGTYDDAVEVRTGKGGGSREARAGRLCRCFRLLPCHACRHRRSC